MFSLIKGAYSSLKLKISKHYVTNLFGAGKIEDGSEYLKRSIFDSESDFKKQMYDSALDKYFNCAGFVPKDYIENKMSEAIQGEDIDWGAVVKIAKTCDSPEHPLCLDGIIDLLSKSAVDSPIASVILQTFISTDETLKWAYVSDEKIQSIFQSSELASKPLQIVVPFVHYDNLSLLVNKKLEFILQSGNIKVFELSKFFSCNGFAEKSILLNKDNLNSIVDLFEYDDTLLYFIQNNLANENSTILITSEFNEAVFVKACERGFTKVVEFCLEQQSYPVPDEVIHDTVIDCVRSKNIEMIDKIAGSTQGLFIVKDILKKLISKNNIDGARVLLCTKRLKDSLTNKDKEELIQTAIDSNNAAIIGQLYSFLDAYGANGFDSLDYALSVCEEENQPILKSQVFSSNPSYMLKRAVTNNDAEAVLRYVKDPSIQDNLEEIANPSLDYISRVWEFDIFWAPEHKI